MTILTEGARKAEFMISEANDWRSRDEVTVTVPANTTLEAGTVLGEITSSGKFVRHAAGASDGSESEAGILFASLVNGTGSAVDFEATNLARDAEVRGSDLTYEDGADAAQITTSNAALAALGIIVR
ncbi:head decoration protein [Roseobacter sp. HKCCD9010]|uniref:head decoration protein n=1 Tax=unclassified Roseobacter TaxID=196798 RepID=UPI0014922CB4|nr:MULTISPECIES: head decoration protein [unclassified Roseobacter]MBF9050646.1 head decoration protein [Rhodobacterales bacterium HKCCD4356]NNV11936.1 head decoration protein [Roseobacter sp. HKCCD7357]NNV16949.1 head decoration protein [Roseobacter sp. HKCCD8768]NNV26178.1 head decoration protein [Roseobacter sp. HKCCD8192]NNV30673.1 head decoration protein [Roseobacter sp. HKCCD9061]